MSFPSHLPIQTSNEKDDLEIDEGIQFDFESDFATDLDEVSVTQIAQVLDSDEVTTPDKRI